MTHRNLLVRSAPLALSAAALLSSAAVTAQDAVPQDTPIILPQVEEAAAPAPAIVLPDVTEATPQPMTTAQETAPAADAPESVMAPTRSLSRASTSPMTSAPATSAASSTAPTSGAAQTPTAQALPVASVAPETSTAEPAAMRETSVDDGLIAGMLGALGLAGVAGVAFLSSRRRRQRAAEGLGYVEPGYSTVARDLRSAPAPVRATAPAQPAIVLEPPVASAAYVSARSTDPVALPHAIPATVEERTALIQRLVDAPPDRANPFQSHKARTRRARMIVQSLHRSFTNRKPRIDLSEYTQRWPSLRGWSPATA